MKFLWFHDTNTNYEDIYIASLIYEKPYYKNDSRKRDGKLGGF